MGCSSDATVNQTTFCLHLLVGCLHLLLLLVVVWVLLLLLLSSALAASPLPATAALTSAAAAPSLVGHVANFTAYAAAAFTPAAAAGLP